MTDGSREIAPSSAEAMLDTLYLYQNPTTGEVSTTARWTSRQLCRLLCPSTSTAILPQHLTLDTQILRLNTDGSYANTGWQAAKTAPIVRQAVEIWYYEQDGAVEGPVSSRQLATLYYACPVVLYPTSRVYSESTPSWTPIQSLPLLQLALEALRPNGVNSLGTTQDTPTYDPGFLAFPSNTKVSEKEYDEIPKEAKDELEVFLQSTAIIGGSRIAEDEEDETYESDNGTRYVKDPRTGNWIHEALAPKQPHKKESNEAKSSSHLQTASAHPPKKRKKAKFAAKNSKCWIYVTGLPPDCTEEEIASIFCKAGIIDLDPETQQPKIKIYLDQASGLPKGDASICYARAESVDLAVTLLDEAPFRPSVRSDACVQYVLHVERAKFEQRGRVFDDGRQRVSLAKRKVAKLAAVQATDWDEGEFNGRLTGGRKGLRIVVLKHLFDPSVLSANEEDGMLAVLERDLRKECEQWGVVEKITIFSKNLQGVVVVKFAQPGSASDAIKHLDGLEWPTGSSKRRVHATFWDGVTDFTVRNEIKEQEEAEKRQKEFGNWLEKQELPEELRLRITD